MYSHSVVASKPVVVLDCKREGVYITVCVSMQSVVTSKTIP